MYLLWLLKFIKKYEEQDEYVTKILKTYEIHFVPVLNPDGYEYSRASKVKLNTYQHIWI